jgi:hypothetical protein
MAPAPARVSTFSKSVLMRSFLSSVGCLLLVSTAVFAQTRSIPTTVTYRAEADWLKLPAGRTEIGSMHGDIAVSSAGDVYISVEGSVRQRFAILGPNPGLQVYTSRGEFMRNVPGAPSDLHGFIIRKEPTGEFIYAVRLAGAQTEADQTRANIDKQSIIKMTLDGEIVQAISASAIPDQFKNKSSEGRPVTRLTGIAVAPNGDIYAADGYASNYIHRFDQTGKYIQSFGGKNAPYGFNTLHKLAVDTRFTPARIIACDRANGRVVHLSLDGEFLDVIVTDVNTPAAVAIHGDYAAIAELRPGAVTSKALTGTASQVTLLDKAGKVVAVLGTNIAADEIGTNSTEPSRWRTGIVTAPHGVAFNSEGDLFVAEFSLFGRIHRFNAQHENVTQQRQR